MIFHRDNARPRVAKNVQKMLHEFNWKILPQPHRIITSFVPLFLTGIKFDNIDSRKKKERLKK